MKKYLMLILSIILSMSAINVDAATCDANTLRQLKSQIPQDLYTLSYEDASIRKISETDGSVYYEDGHAIIARLNMNNGNYIKFSNNGMDYELMSDDPRVLMPGVNTVRIYNVNCDNDLLGLAKVYIPDFDEDVGFTDGSVNAPKNDNEKKFDYSLLIIVIIMVGLIALIVYLVMYILKQRRNGYE